MSAWIAGTASHVLELACFLLWELGETHPKPLQCECVTRTMACEICTFSFFLCQCYVVSTAYMNVPCMVGYLESNTQQNDLRCPTFWKTLKDHSLLMVDASDDSLFGLEVTDRFIPQTLEKGAQVTDCENSNFHSQSPSRTKSIKGDRIDALNTSKGTWFCWERSTNLPPQDKALWEGVPKQELTQHFQKSGRTGRWALGGNIQATNWLPQLPGFYIK